MIVWLQQQDILEMKIGEWFRNEIVIKLHSGKEVKNESLLLVKEKIPLSTACCNFSSNSALSKAVSCNSFIKIKNKKK